MRGFTDKDIECFNGLFHDLKKKDASIISFKKGQLDGELEIVYVENEGKDSRDPKIGKYEIFPPNNK